MRSDWVTRTTSGPPACTTVRRRRLRPTDRAPSPAQPSVRPRSPEPRPRPTPPVHVRQAGHDTHRRPAPDRPIASPTAPPARAEPSTDRVTRRIPRTYRRRRPADLHFAYGATLGTPGHRRHPLCRSGRPHHRLVVGHRRGHRPPVRRRRRHRGGQLGHVGRRRTCAGHRARRCHLRAGRHRRGGRLRTSRRADRRRPRTARHPGQQRRHHRGHPPQRPRRRVPRRLATHLRDERHRHLAADRGRRAPPAIVRTGPGASTSRRWPAPDRSGARSPMHAPRRRSAT